MSLEKQPFTLNHEGNTLKEIFNITEEEFLALTGGDVTEDIPFGIMLLNTLDNNLHEGLLIAFILEGLTGLKIDIPSKLVEYIVRGIKEEEQRRSICEVLLVMHEKEGGLPDILQLKKMMDTLLKMKRSLEKDYEQTHNKDRA